MHSLVVHRDHEDVWTWALDSQRNRVRESDS